MPQTNLPASNWLQSLFQNINRRLTALETRVSLVVKAQATSGSTTYSSTSWGTSSGGPSVTAIIGQSGACIVTLSAFIIPGSNPSGETAQAGLSVDSAVTPTAPYLAVQVGASSGLGGMAAVSFPVTGLTPGQHTFSLLYQVSGPGIVATYEQQSMVVQPL